MKYKNFTLCGHFLSIFFYIYVLVGCPHLSASDTRGILPIGNNVADLVRLKDGSLLAFTWKFEVLELPNNAREWTSKEVTIENNENVAVLRVQQVVQPTDTSLMAVGDIQVVKESQHLFAFLISSNAGNSWTAIPFSSDPKDAPLNVKVSKNGFMILLDVSGKVWTSGDKGHTWNLIQLPIDIRNNSVLKIDMLSEQIGVCIDNNNSIFITTDGWKSVRKVPVDSESSVSMQFSDGLHPNNSFFLWSNELVYATGQEVFTTELNLISWKKWPYIQTAQVDVEQSALITLDIEGNLKRWYSKETKPRSLASNIMLPNFFRCKSGFVLVYRSDTGPMLVDESSVQQRRFFSHNLRINSPKQIIKGTLHDWGIGYTSASDLFVDILLPASSGEWYRDTTIRCGGMNVWAHGTDSLLFESGGTMMVYDATKRFFRPFEVIKPLTLFLKSRLQKMTVQVTQKFGTGEKKYFTEYKLQAGAMVCTSLQELKPDGPVYSEYGNTIDLEAVQTVLEAINRKGATLPRASEITVTPEIKQDYQRWLDTVLHTCTQFSSQDSTADSKKKERHYREMKSRFSQAAIRANELQDNEVVSSMLALNFTKVVSPLACEIQLENEAGDRLHMKLENRDTPYPPLLSPWRITFRKNVWLSYELSIASFYLNGIAQKVIPKQLREKQHVYWYLLGVANYLDAQELGKRYFWSE